MAYKVINRFKDAEDGTVYEVGDEYPKSKKKPSKKRLDALTKTHEKYGVAFIEEVKEEE